MPSTHNAPRDVLPLKPADFHILMVLLEGELHGYGIMQQVAEQSGGVVRLELGSLYRLIARMTDLGLIADAHRRRVDDDRRRGDDDRRRGDDDRRRYYRVTPYGREVAKSEARRLEEVVRTARAHKLLEDKPASPVPRRFPSPRGCCASRWRRSRSGSANATRRK